MADTSDRGGGGNNGSNNQCPGGYTLREALAMKRDRYDFRYRYVLGFEHTGNGRVRMVMKKVRTI